MRIHLKISLSHWSLQSASAINNSYHFSQFAVWKGSELVLQIALLKIKEKLNLSCVCSGWVCNLLELSEEVWQHTRLTAPGHRIQGSSVTLPFWVPSLALIGTSLEINENDILCSSCSGRRMLQKGPSQFITNSIYTAMALKHYLWDVNFLSAVSNLNTVEEEWKKILRVCVYENKQISLHLKNVVFELLELPSQ